MSNIYITELVKQYEGEFIAYLRDNGTLFWSDFDINVISFDFKTLPNFELMLTLWVKQNKKYTDQQRKICALRDALYDLEIIE